MARLVMVTGILALTAVLSASCGGGGDDRAEVEASLRHYLGTLTPEHSAFPVGAGSPRVKDNGCWDRHLEVEKSFPWWGIQVRPKGRLALWQCVVKFGTLAMPVLVAVDDSTEVLSAMPGGVLKEVKPSASQPSTVGDCPPQGC